MRTTHTTTPASSTTRRTRQATPRPGMLAMLWAAPLEDERDFVLVIRAEADGRLLVMDAAGGLQVEDPAGLRFPARGSLFERIAGGVAALLAKDPEVGGLIRRG